MHNALQLPVFFLFPFFFPFFCHPYPGLWITRDHNSISFPEIKRLLLEDATISSKTDSRNGSKKEKRSDVNIRNNKTMLKILLFISILS